MFFSSLARLSTFTRLSIFPLALKPPLETSHFPCSANILSAFTFTSVKKNTQSLKLVDLFRLRNQFANTGSCNVFLGDISQFVRENNSTQFNILQQTNAHFRQVVWAFYNLLRKFLLFCENR